MIAASTLLKEYTTSRKTSTRNSIQSHTTASWSVLSTQYCTLLFGDTIKCTSRCVVWSLNFIFPLLGSLLGIWIVAPLCIVPILLLQWN